MERFTVTIATSFACDGLVKTVEHYTKTFSQSIRFEWSSYGAIDHFLECSSPSSIPSEGMRASILVFRFEDIVHSHPELAPEIERSEQSWQLWKTSAEAFSRRVIECCKKNRGNQLILYQFPSSPGKADLSGRARGILLREIEHSKGLSNVHIDGQNPSFFDLYPAFVSEKIIEETLSSVSSSWYDKAADRAAHAPLTSIATIALGQQIARQTFRCLPTLKTRKVIVLDCDNTLWQSAVGEVGVHNVSITKYHRLLQKFFTIKHTQGMLLCLCSKNNETDILKVFQERKDEMILHIEKHIVAYRVNWKDKAQNLRSLAKELDLGLDSFVFVDDNPGECAHVRNQLPEVAVVQIPFNYEEMALYLWHSWVFDRPVKLGSIFTDEDVKRTEFYKAAAKRKREYNNLIKAKIDNRRAGAASNDWQDFIGGLALKANFQNRKNSESMVQKIPRILQLIERTNQFNLSGVKKSSCDISKLLNGDDSGKLTVVSVTDRFGHYGDVGLLLWIPKYRIMNCPTPVFWVEIFLLSCRALQRGVEHLMLQHIAQYAKQDGCNQMYIQWRETERNNPSKLFLQSIPDAIYNDVLKAYVIPVTEACRFNPNRACNTLSDNIKDRSNKTDDKHTINIRQSFVGHAAIVDNVECVRCANAKALQTTAQELKIGEAVQDPTGKANYSKLFHSLKRSGSNPRVRGVLRDEIKVMLGETPYDSKNNARPKEDEESRKRRRKQEKIERGRLWRLKNGFNKGK